MAASLRSGLSLWTTGAGHTYPQTQIRMRGSTSSLKWVPADRVNMPVALAPDNNITATWNFCLGKSSLKTLQHIILQVGVVAPIMRCLAERGAFHLSWVVDTTGTNRNNTVQTDCVSLFVSEQKQPASTSELQQTEGPAFLKRMHITHHLSCPSYKLRPPSRFVKPLK